MPSLLSRDAWCESMLRAPKMAQIMKSNHFFECSKVTKVYARVSDFCDYTLVREMNLYYIKINNRETNDCITSVGGVV